MYRHRTAPKTAKKQRTTSTTAAAGMAASLCSWYVNTPTLLVVVVVVVVLLSLVLVCGWYFCRFGVGVCRFVVCWCATCVLQPHTQPTCSYFVFRCSQVSVDVNLSWCRRWCFRWYLVCCCRCTYEVVVVLLLLLLCYTNTSIKSGINSISAVLYQVRMFFIYMFLCTLYRPVQSTRGRF